MAPPLPIANSPPCTCWNCVNLVPACRTHLEDALSFLEDYHGLDLNLEAWCDKARELLSGKVRR